MKPSHLALLVPAMLVLAGLSCEMLDSIQQDSNLVQNPDLSDEARNATAVANAATLEAETYSTLTAEAASATADVTFTQTATKAASPTPTATLLPNHPPVITNFTANFIPADRTTYYEVKAYDPDSPDLTGFELKYEWSNTNTCGTFIWDSETFASSTVSWAHPHPPCPDERVHPAFIKVVVSDEEGGQAVFEYTSGSASGSVEITPVP
jgi:hypothetical protein